ncbi:MAG: glycogen-binding domain-containing protein [Deinococcales bacterium]
MPGSFNNWDTAANSLELQVDSNSSGNWCITLMLAAGEYEYKYFIDQEWTTDPDAIDSNDDGFGGLNAIFALSEAGEILPVGEANLEGISPLADKWLVASNSPSNSPVDPQVSMQVGVSQTSETDTSKAAMATSQEAISSLPSEVEETKTETSSEVAFVEPKDASAPQAVTGGILFSYLGPGAQKAVLRGSFNNWGETPMQKSPQGVWYVVVDLAPGSYQYKFFVDEVWLEDPNDLTSADDGFGGKNSVVDVVRTESGALALAEAGESASNFSGFVYGRFTAGPDINQEGRFAALDNSRAGLVLGYGGEGLELTFNLGGSINEALEFAGAQIRGEFSGFELAMGYNLPLFDSDKLSYSDQFGFGLTALGLSTQLNQLELGLYAGVNLELVSNFVLAYAQTELEGLMLRADGLFATGGWSNANGGGYGGAILLALAGQFDQLSLEINAAASFGGPEVPNLFSIGNGFAARARLGYVQDALSLKLYSAFASEGFKLDLAGISPQRLKLINHYGLSTMHWRNQEGISLMKDFNGYSALNYSQLDLSYALNESLSPRFHLASDYQGIEVMAGLGFKLFDFESEAGLSFTSRFNSEDPSPQGLGAYLIASRSFNNGTFYVGIESAQAIMLLPSP